MGALGIAILSRQNKTDKIYDLKVNDIKFETKGYECGKCPNNCEILKIYKNNELIETIGSLCGRE